MTIAILSWGSHKTLLNTLTSYRNYELNDAQKIIYFQEITDDDIQIAKDFGYEWIGSNENIGIGPAYAELIKHAKGEFFLFLENDWELIENPHMELYAAEILLNQKVIDVARFRHRVNHGHPLWTLQFKGREMDKPTHLLDSVHWSEPGVDYPDLVKLVGVDLDQQDSTYISFTFSVASSQNANWTNNPTMFRTEWLKEIILPMLGSADVEKDIQGWWELQEFQVGQSRGLFTHHRIG